jgi:hypothetical protein
MHATFSLFSLQMNPVSGMLLYHLCCVSVGTLTGKCGGHGSYTQCRGGTKDEALATHLKSFPFSLIFPASFRRESAA